MIARNPAHSYPYIEGLGWAILAVHSNGSVASQHAKALQEDMTVQVVPSEHPSSRFEHDLRIWDENRNGPMPEHGPLSDQGKIQTVERTHIIKGHPSSCIEVGYIDEYQYAPRVLAVVVGKQPLNTRMCDNREEALDALKYYTEHKKWPF